MSYLAVTCPHCGEQQRHEVFGSGGGESTAQRLSARLGYPVPLLGQIPLDPELRAGGDDGTPIVVGAPDRPAAVALDALATRLAKRGRGLLGKQLGLAPAGRG
jgi:ATP-binding protein involved in chromosome partitioning